MDIGSILGLGIGQQQGAQRSGKLQAVIDTIINNGSAARADDITTLSAVAQLQSGNSVVRQAIQNLAQADSLSQVATKGLSEVAQGLRSLQDIAQRAASPQTDDVTRATLNNQFQEILTNVNRIVSETSFGDQKLLDGSLSGAEALSLEKVLSGRSGETDDVTFTIPDLSPGSSLSVATQGGAQTALTALGEALDRTAQAAEAAEGFRRAGDGVFAYIESVTANQFAAASVLLDADLEASNDVLSSLLTNFQQATAAQGNNLSSAVIKLIG